MTPNLARSLELLDAWRASGARTDLPEAEMDALIQADVDLLNAEHDCHWQPGGLYYVGKDASGRTSVALSRGYTFAEVASAEIAFPEYLVKGLIDKGELGFLFGESGSMKSFVLTDLLFHAATGQDWHGHRVASPSGVLIVLGEGQAGYRKRLKAIQIATGISEAPIFVCPEPVSLVHDPAQLRDWIKDAEERIGCRVDVIALDTFSLMLGGRDESSNADVSLSLLNARTAADGRTLLFVHHCGHGDKQRERGAYQIRANADVSILVTRDEDNHGRVVTVSSVKAKDSMPFEPVNLTYRVIPVGHDTDGDEVTSLVMLPTDATPKQVARDSKPLAFVKQAIQILGTNQRETVRPKFYELYGGSEEANRKAFRRGWDGYMNAACSVDDDF